MTDRNRQDPFASRRTAGVAMPHRRARVLAYMPPRMDDRVRHALEVGRVRMLVVGAALLFAFTIVGGRLAQFAVLGVAGGEAVAHTGDTGTLRPRANILDRNGEILATDLPTASLFANARRLLDPEEAARSLVDA
ncbi:MAG TPA: hypothetical protein ENO23_00050, partial [Alphaproteobacteria bacterium]|nr:hypothetical protein [Alphaproteobacteria bacterium]